MTDTAHAQRDEQRGQRQGQRGDERPHGPTDLRRRSWIGALRRTVKEYQNDNLGDWAAALTYYGILSIFPALVAILAILGLFGHSVTQPLIENLNKLAPSPARSVFTSAVENLNRSRGAAGPIAIVSILIALWSASGYVSGFMRASNAIYDIEEGRPFVKRYAVRFGTTVVMVLLLIASAFAVVFTGGLAGQLGNLLGVGKTGVQVWDIAKWPVLVLVVSFMFAVLYWAAPNVRHPAFRWLSPGGLLAVVLWIVASGAFAAYVANFASYNKTYGAIAGVVVFLVWLWITNTAILLGAELNAELERSRGIERGQPPEQEPFVEPRDEPKPSSDAPKHRRAA